MSHRSIGRKLPLLISLLLATVAGALSWAAYRTVERALVAAKASHLLAAAQQLSVSLDGAARRLVRDAGVVARDTTIELVLAGADELARRTARGTLDSLVAARAQTVAYVIADAAKRPVLSAGQPPATGATLDDGPSGRSRDGDPIFGLDASVKFVSSRDSVFTQVTVPISLGASDTAGYLIEYRRLSGNNSTQLIRGLIGQEARFAVGNADGLLWTDFAGPTFGPPMSDEAALQYRGADGQTRLAAMVIMPGTEWRISVELPRHVALAPAREVLGRMLLVAVIVLAIGAFLAWRLSRRITAPLAEVAQAAEGIAAGDYARRVDVRRRDEIGLLATSFNSMAARVEESTQLREEQAAELRYANQRLSRAVAEADRARNEAERAATELRALVDAVTDVVLYLDRDGRYIKILETGTDKLALPPTELLGRRVHDVLPELSADAVLRTIRQALGEQRRVEVEYSLELGERGIHWFAAAASPMPDGTVLWVARDVTEHHALEEQLRQSQKMEAVGQLAGGIAHDFNNMLTAIRSFSELLLADIPAETPHGADLLEIQRAADRAAALTRKLLAFSRRQLLQPVPMDMNTAVRGMEEMLRRLLGEDVECVWRLAPDLFHAMADPGQIEQIVLNLAVNARDAMPDGGRLTVETTNVDVDEGYAARVPDMTAGQYVVLAVSDTGTGMDGDTQARIFEPFFTTKEAGKGTGLGLSTVYGIVKQSGGHIAVYSEPGHGTTFRIYLPRAQGKTTSEREPRGVAIPLPTGTETILLVEDDPAVRLVACRILARQGYRVLEAAAPAEAEALVARHRGVIDLVLTDLVLPGMSGRELAEILTAVEPRMRVLYMSGYTDDAVIRRGLLEPGMAFLPKPFTMEEVARVVRATLDGRPTTVAAARRAG